MENEIPQYFELIKEYFLTQLSMFSGKRPPIINNRALSIHSKNDNILKNYVLELTIENSVNERKIFFSYSEGPNAKRPLSNHIVFEVENISEIPFSGRKNFFIGDFCEFYNIELPESSFYETTGGGYSIEKFKKYIDSVILIIESTNLKKILKGDIWIDIPINMKPYK